ncbi:MAG: hypothetical protein D6806_12415, partial [Deltaproteobacteria bacterium]
PTLLDDPLLPFRKDDWTRNNVWLHMPPLPFWQAAESLALLGRSFFALRLPNLLLLLLTLYCVFALGRRWFGAREGLLAAGIYLLSPLGWLLVQGYHFGDMTDVSLAAWVAACILAADKAIETAGLRWMVAAGLFQAAAVLSKSALGIVPAGAVIVLWVAGRWKRAGFRGPGGLQVALHWVLGLGPYIGWQLYCRYRWPEEAAIEARAQWLHVVSNYEGHGRSWDALFNDLVANLFAPALILWVLAAGAFVLWRASRMKDRANLWLATLAWGTWLPLLAVKTKVPAVLWGMMPAACLSLAVLLSSLLRRTGAISLALLYTPAVFMVVGKYTPGDFFRFAEPVAPALAVWPHLPLQLMIWLCLCAVFIAAKFALSGIRVHGRKAVTVLAVLAVSLALAGVLGQLLLVRSAFSKFEGFNPAACLAEHLRKAPRDARVIVEGWTNGRQRPALTLSALTGLRAELVAPSLVEPAWKAASAKGSVFLATPFERPGGSTAGPESGCGWFLYENSLAARAGGTSTGTAALPEIEHFYAEESVFSAGDSIAVVLEWHAAASMSGCVRSFRFVSATTSIAAVADRPALEPGAAAEALEKLAPPGWFGGHVEWCGGLCPGWTIPPGARFVERPLVPVPDGVAPGRYVLRMDVACPAGSRSFSGPAVVIE